MFYVLKRRHRSANIHSRTDHLPLRPYRSGPDPSSIRNCTECEELLRWPQWPTRTHHTGLTDRTDRVVRADQAARVNRSTIKWPPSMRRIQKCTSTLTHIIRRRRWKRCPSARVLTSTPATATRGSREIFSTVISFQVALPCAKRTTMYGWTSTLTNGTPTTTTRRIAWTNPALRYTPRRTYSIRDRSPFNRTITETNC